MLKLSNGCFLDPDAILCCLQQPTATKVFMSEVGWLTLTAKDGGLIKEHFEQHPRTLRQQREELLTEKLEEMLELVSDFLHQVLLFRPGALPFTFGSPNVSETDTPFPSDLPDSESPDAAAETGGEE